MQHILERFRRSPYLSEHREKFNDNPKTANWNYSAEPVADALSTFDTVPVSPDYQGRILQIYAWSSHRA